MITTVTIFAVPAIIAITVGSVVLISKLGGKTASRRIRYLRGIDDSADNNERT